MSEELKKDPIRTLISAQAEIEPRIFLMGHLLLEAIKAGKLRHYLSANLQRLFEPLEEYLKRDQEICRIAAFFYDEINDEFVGHTLLSPHFSAVERRCAQYITNYIEAAAEPNRELRLVFQEFLTRVIFRYKGDKSPVLLSYEPDFDLHGGPESYSQWIANPKGGRAFRIDMRPLDQFHAGHIEPVYKQLMDFVQKNPQLPMDPLKVRVEPQGYKVLEEALDCLIQEIGEGLFAEQRQKFLDHFQFQGNLPEKEFLRQLLWNRLLDLKWRFLYLLPARVLGNLPVGGLVVSSKRPLDFEEFHLVQTFSHRLFSDSALAFARLEAEKVGAERTRAEVLSRLSRFFAHNLAALVQTARDIADSSDAKVYALTHNLYDQVSWLAALTGYVRRFEEKRVTKPTPVLAILLRAYFAACEMTTLEFKKGCMHMDVDYNTDIGRNRRFRVEFTPPFLASIVVGEATPAEVKTLRVRDIFASDFEFTPEGLRSLFRSCDFDEPSLDQDQVCVPAFTVSIFTEQMYNALKRSQPITLLVRESKDKNFVVIRIENRREGTTMGEESGIAGVKYTLGQLGWFYWHTGMNTPPEWCDEKVAKWLDENLFQWLIHIPRSYVTKESGRS